ncbi:MAG: metallophosphoesterase [Paraglaciecola sp.]|nr:metallophosphoesterase [Paraglaciecola sp.]
MRVIVINDIHSNSYALNSIVEHLQSIEFDKIIILGDLFTYGVNVIETLDLLIKLNKNFDCVFIKGNHDQIYFDYQNGVPFEYKPFPPFILESVHFNAKLLPSNLINQFDWVDNYIFNDVIFAHANLFPYGDWSYLNTEDDFLKNCNELIIRNYRGAVFGHTHRAKYNVYNDLYESTGIKSIESGVDFILCKAFKFLITNGSIGQPRGGTASFLVCEILDAEFKFRSVDIAYDIQAHCDSISDSSLTFTTKNRLLNFYR